jgi:hypothetical protein
MEKMRLATFARCVAAVWICLPAALSRAQQLYWSQFGTPRQVGHVSLNGTGSVTLIQTDQVLGMETLDATQKVYWADNDAATIVRANADFSGVTTLVTGLGAQSHLNLALDPAANLIFWSNSGAGTIGRASLSGGPIIGTFTSPGSYPDDLAVDPIHQLLYWCVQTGQVFRSNYDGTGQVTLFSVGPELGQGASGLDLDLPGGKIYLSIPNQNRIVRATLDGSGSQTVVSTPERPFGMELYNGHIYWTDLDGGRLRSANLDGSDVTTILSGLSQPRQVSIMTVPEPDGIALAALGPAIWFWSRYRADEGRVAGCQSRKYCSRS